MGGCQSALKNEVKYWFDVMRKLRQYFLYFHLDFKNIDAVIYIDLIIK